MIVRELVARKRGTSHAARASRDQAAALVTLNAGYSKYPTRRDSAIFKVAIANKEDQLSDVLVELRKPFPVEQVRKNQDGLDYVAIDGYINRLLDVLGLDYDFKVTESELTLLPDTMKTRSGKMQYLARATGELTINSAGRSRATRAGVGADVSHDPDKALKTAQAEALKKACHQFGIALELWDEEHRQKLARQRGLTTDAGVKREVWKIARDKTGLDKPSAAQVAKVFGRKATELNDVATLRQILADEGVL